MLTVEKLQSSGVMNNPLTSELLTSMRAKSTLKDHICGSVTATSGVPRSTGPLHILAAITTTMHYKRTLLVTVRCINTSLSNYIFIPVAHRLCLPTLCGLFRSSDIPTGFSIRKDSGVCGSAYW